MTLPLHFGTPLSCIHLAAVGQSSSDSHSTGVLQPSL